MSLWHIAWSYLWNRKLTTVMTVVSVALASSDDNEGTAVVHAAGIALLDDVLQAYAGVADPDVPTQPVLQQYQAQV